MLMLFIEKHFLYSA